MTPERENSGRFLTAVALGLIGGASVILLAAVVLVPLS